LLLVLLGFENRFGVGAPAPPRLNNVLMVPVLVVSYLKASRYWLFIPNGEIE
jgi:hypothetical protein